MRTKRQLMSIVLVCAFAASTSCMHSQAAEVVLPKLEETFKDAKIGRTYKDSKPGMIALAKAHAGAPSVLMILIDDSEFGQWGTFGGQVPTPNLDRLAKMGLRYTRFHIRNLEKLRLGDTIIITYAEALAISLERQKPRKTRSGRLFQ